MAGDSATTRALGVAELLETILVNLYIKHLIKLKRVCKDWKEAISSSKQLRQICFLEPAEPTRMAVGNLKDFWNLSGVEIVPSAKTQASEKCCLAIVQQHPASKLPDPDLAYIESEKKGVRNINIAISRLRITTPGAMASNVADSTATRALDVVELLENVLINLDLKDRERARGVSHNWNALITTSKSFSQTRFLSPAPYLKTFQAAKSSPRTWTSVFSEDPLWLDRIHTPVQLRSKIHIMAKMRPALQTAPGIAYPYSVMSFEATITPGEFEQWVVKSGWGKAPLTQPPIKEVIVGANTYTSQNGVTIGELCRLAKRALRQELKKPPGYLTVHKRGLSAKVNIKAPGIITDHSIYVRRGPGVEYDMLDRGQIRVCY